VEQIVKKWARTSEDEFKNQEYSFLFVSNKEFTSSAEQSVNMIIDSEKWFKMHQPMLPFEKKVRKEVLEGYRSDDIHHDVMENSGQCEVSGRENYGVEVSIAFHAINVGL
jgi:hypothetical protein